MISGVFLIGALIGLWHTVNALRRPARGRFAVGHLWLPALLTSELALFHIAWQAALSGAFIAVGALESRPGQWALAITVISWAGLVYLFLQGLRAGPVIEAALEAGLGPARPNPSGRAELRRRIPLNPFPRLPRGVEHVPAVPYGDHPRQRVDLYVPEAVDSAPGSLLQIHGGSWMRGTRDRQARPVMYHLASRGWICVAVGYRVSPEATFPDHLVDIKRALAWVKRGGEGRFAEPPFVAVTGGSAGGHLASMLALTANESEYQPGFEQTDTSVQACVPVYGIFDLLRDSGKPLWPFIESQVMKTSPRRDPDSWRRASPIHRVHEEAPPFFILHGTHDSLVDPGQSRRFAQALRRASGALVVDVEVPDATHGFDYFNSARGVATAVGVRRFLDALARVGPGVVDPHGHGEAGSDHRS